MAHTLSLDLPEDTYATLAHFAAAHGKSVEDLGAAWLSAAVARIADDPLIKLAGAVNSGRPDLSTDPDALVADHLGEELLDDETDQPQ